MAERARALRRGGRTLAEVRKLLAAEGHKVSTGWLSETLGGPAPVPSPTSPEDLPSIPLPPPDPTETGAVDIPLLLERAVVALEKLTRAASTEGNVEGFVKAQRVLNTTASLLERIRTPPPVDPNDAPDMRALSKRFRAKLHDLLDRALAGEIAG